MTDWTELEGLLSSSRREPSSELRRRVLAATQAELAGCPLEGRSGASWPIAGRHGTHGWRRLAVAAAALVLWVHVSWSAALDTRFHVRADRTSEVEQVARQIQQLVPDMPAAESWRLAWTSVASADQPIYTLSLPATSNRQPHGRSFELPRRTRSTFR